MCTGTAAPLIPNAYGEKRTPRAVSMDEDGTVLVGQAAESGSSPTPAARPPHLSAAWEPPGRNFAGPEAVQPRGALGAAAPPEGGRGGLLGEPVEEAVVSVPAYFTDRQRAPPSGPACWRD